ncbi:MAG: DUF5719 family protein, partial [Chloroflexota bacterium]
IVAGQGGLQLEGNPRFTADSYPPFSFFGIYLSPAISTDQAFDALGITFEASKPQGTEIILEVRVQSGDNRWSPWQEVESSGQAFSYQAGGVAAQYRATLLSESEGRSPVLEEVNLKVAPADPTEPTTTYQALATRPTVRLYATREGLVGRFTANGHQITERDRFVALPSRKALNSRDGKEYQVEISYNGRKAVAPVWDVGPWNTKDNYWDAEREIFKDLPRFTPQVNAAFFDNYNDGKDQYGRLVLYPAAIDLADGTFWDDLGMKGSDWVDVTFLWVDAAAPPLVPMPKVIPKEGPKPQPIFGQSTAPTPPPAPTPTPTPTPIPKTWYFAEGSTNEPFDTWLLLQNPDPVAANAKVTYMLPDGGQKISNYALKPTSRMSIFLNSEVPNSEVSTMIESDRYILAERAMYFGKEGHATAGAISPSQSWYFAEGGTSPPFETWILIQNPNKEPAVANITFFKEDGSTIAHQMLIPHVSRASLLVNQIVPDAAVATRIEADRPIVAERAIYKDKGKAGSDSIGATALSKTWYMAEGVTRLGFDTWILMLNPNDVPATVTATYMKEDGGTVTKQYLVRERSRVSVPLNQEVPGVRVATKIESDIPIVAERSIYFPDGLGSHNSMGAPEAARLWYLPEGSTAKPFSQNILLMNPNRSPANITALFMKEDGSSVEKKYTLKPTSRLTLEMNSILPDTSFSTRIQADQPVVVERSMYFSDWLGGHNSMGIPWNRP